MTPPTARAIAAVPTFLVDDVGAAIRWYAEQLGFLIAGTFPKVEPYGYASIQLGPAEIMFLRLAGYQKPDLRAQRPESLWDAYIRMDGVSALYQAIHDRPFIHMALKQQPYGDWEFEIRDPNGYTVVFGGSK